jgi:hypothetical protein
MDNMIKLRELGYNVFPINEKKEPTTKGSWKNYEGPLDGIGVGIGMGGVGKLEAIDFDLKYDLTKKMFKEYCDRVKEIDSNILNKVVVQKTKSGGYHFIYSCDVIGGNQKLASRYASEYEKLKGEKVKVLIETRGEGGYIAVDPTPGYKLLRGSFDSIQKITEEERDVLFTVAKEFNNVVKEEYQPVIKPKKTTKGLSPFEDYNDRADVVSLLCSHGWSISGNKGNKVLLKRPGDTSAKSSGNYDYTNNWFSVFSTSTEFEPEKGYLPYAVFSILECKGDFSEAARRLYDMGYGERREEQEKPEVKSKIDILSDDFSFIADQNEIKDYIERIRNGTFEMGISTGIPELDKHFLHKRGYFNVVNGHDNVGKSTVIWYLFLLSSMLHGWKWIIYSSENRNGAVFKRICEFYLGIPINKMNEMQLRKASEFINKHFVIIKITEMYNYVDILNIGDKLMKKDAYNGFLIDPYNSLKIEINERSKLSTHDYHYLAASEMQLWAKKNNCTIYLNCHAVTQALRVKDGNGYPVAPQKADTEGGGKFSNKADDFITLHRVTQHPTDWMVTEIHVRKVKESETGGKPTPIDQPIKLVMQPGGVSFACGKTGIDPIKKIHEQKGDYQMTIPDSSSNQFPNVEPKPLTPNEVFDLTEDPTNCPF